MNFCEYEIIYKNLAEDKSNFEQKFEKKSTWPPYLAEDISVKPKPT